jgi:predicted DNA-binding transcriptional regulator AlpA
MKTPAYPPFDDLPDAALIQIRQLVNYKLLPYSATTYWRKHRNGEFPSPIKLSEGISAFKVGEIRAHINAISKSPKGSVK